MKQKRKGTQPKLFVRPGTFKISGGSREGAPFPLILGGKKKRIAEGRKAGRATDKKSQPPLPPLLAQGLDPPLKMVAFVGDFLSFLRQFFISQATPWNL